MPEVVCGVCDGLYDLAMKQHKLLSHKAIQFCSISCVLSFIQRKYVIKNYLVSDKKSPFVQSPYEIWDEITEDWYRSWYEVYVARFLRLNNIYAEYESRAILYNFSGGHCRKYTPDFWLPQYKLYIEVKGLWRMSAKKKFETVINDIGSDRLILLPWHLHNEFKRKCKI
jgi:hypothetical protein